MFKALHRKTRHEIVIIGYHGELLEALRAQGHAGGIE